MILAMNVSSDILRRPASHHYGWGGDCSAPASPKRVSLPPIHKSIPELDQHRPIRLSPPDTATTAPSTAMSARTTPTSQPSLVAMSPPSIAMTATPEYVHSPADSSSAYKRRRLLETPVSAQGPRYHARSELRQPPSSGYSHSRSRSHGYHGYSADDDRPPILGGTAGESRERLSQAVPRLCADPESRHFEYGEAQPSRHARVSMSASPPSQYSRHETSSTSRPGYSDSHSHSLRFGHHPEPPTRYAHDAYRSSGHRPPQTADYQERPYRHYVQAPPYAPDYSSQYAQHPSRLQSLSAGSVPSYNRAAFPSMTAPGTSYAQPRPFLGQPCATGPMATPVPGYPHYNSRDYPAGGGYMSTGVMGGMGNGNGTVDGKQRKRRGNLPKETTDKLRAWFLNHLHHPYPSEDEKQDLMRQTGLQMNQISNWFINARRRQLPGMLKNARAESNAMTSRSSSSAAGVRRNSNGSLDGRREHRSLSPASAAYQQQHQQMTMRQFQPHKRQASDYGDDDRGNVFPRGSPISDDGYDSVPRPRQLTRGSV